MGELDAETRDAGEADLLIAPIVGLQMPLPRLQLPSGVRVVRADTVDAPIEAMRSEGMQRAAWEPQYLALAEQGEGPEGASSALNQLHDLISVLRLYREGSIGLGPYAFAPTGEESWRRIATGAPPTRPGGYQLSEDDSIEIRGSPTISRSVPIPRALSPGRSRGSRWAASGPRPWKGSAITCWQSAQCSRAGSGRRAAADPGRGSPARRARARRRKLPDRARPAARARLMSGGPPARAGRRAPSRRPGLSSCLRRSCATRRSASSAPTSAPRPTRP